MVFYGSKAQYVQKTNMKFYLYPNISKHKSNKETILFHLSTTIMQSQKIITSIHRN